MLPKGKNYVIICEFQFYGGTGTKPNFSAAAETSELFIDNYNGGKCGSMKEKFLSQQPQKRCNLMIRRCEGFLTLKEKPFELKFALQVYSENPGTLLLWPSTLAIPGPCPRN